MITRTVTREYQETSSRGFQIRAPRGEDETYTYDAAGRLITFSKTIQLQKDPTRITTYRYDADGRCLEATAVNEKGNNMGGSRWTYDAKGREVEFAQHDIASGRLLRRSTTYTDAGTTVKTEVLVNERVERIVTETLDLQGQRTTWESATPNGPDSQDITRETVTNAIWGQQRAREMFRKVGEEVKTYKPVINYDYLTNGQLLASITNASNTQREFRLQSYNRQGMSTGQLTMRTPLQASALQLPPPTLTSYTYDANDNWVAKVDFEYTLDQSGNLVIVDGQPKVKRTVTTRTITYANTP